jgi:enoyl-CoA hydratase
VALLQFEVQEDSGIGIITFDRPKALNALSRELLNELATTLDAVEKDENIRVLILTGGGDKAFIAGADIGEIQKLTPLGARSFGDVGQNIIDRLQHLPIPVIAAVNGFALGGGCEMALACDFIYAADTAIFGLPEIGLGIIPGFGGTQRLPKLIGANMAREMIFTGRHIKAEEAQQIGLVNKCFAKDQLMNEVIAVAKIIASKGKFALKAAKDVVRQGLVNDLPTGLAMERDAFALCIASPDAKEGTTAFLEKRKPTFTGKRDQ